VTSEMGVIEGPRARWVNSDSPFAELSRDYPKPRCPKCGSEEYQMCTNWAPVPGLDPDMKMVRCRKFLSSMPHTNIDDDGEEVIVQVLEFCNTEYYLAPMLKVNSRGTVL
jgi:hypothetical protein